MKLVSKKVRINDDSFNPELEIVIRFPLETLQDSKALDANFYEKLGRDLGSLITQQ
jgi:hypothetical protein